MSIQNKGFKLNKIADANSWQSLNSVHVMATLGLDVPPGSDRKSCTNCATEEHTCSALPNSAPAHPAGAGLLRGTRCLSHEKLLQRQPERGWLMQRDGRPAFGFFGDSAWNRSAGHRPQLPLHWVSVPHCYSHTQCCLLPLHFHLEAPLPGLWDANVPSHQTSLLFLVLIQDTTWETKPVLMGHWLATCPL